jgi:hypothetical protein
MNRYVLFFTVFLFILVLASGCSSSNPENQKLDECFKILDKTVIHDAGKMEIDRIVNDTSYLEKDPKRLTLIADIITRDFTDPYWAYQQNEENFCYYPDDKEMLYNHCRLEGQNNLKSIGSINDLNNSYLFDKRGRVRQIIPSAGMIVLSRDPYWIAFQKTGACKELSVLFNKTANDSGFVIRVVYSDGIGHYWNEVNINGEWKFFDVQRYGSIKKDTTDPSTWFGNTSDYANADGWPLCNMINNGSTPGIFVCNPELYCNNESRNDAYDPNNNCTKKSTVP